MSVTEQLFINNKWQDARGGAMFDVLSPATEQVIAKVASAQEEDISDAVAAARSCFNGPDWGLSSTGAQRARCLRALADELEADKEAFARLETEDCGKPIGEANDDIIDAIDCFRFYAGLAEALDKEEPEPVALSDDKFVSKVVREPLGVVGAITPWNYPLLMAVQKVAASLAAGCTVVLKPSELAPLTCIRLGKLVEKAGLPPGAVNIVSGLGAPAGSSLSAHHGVDKVSFTGSVATGQ
ncbi:unnamed protein product, partial [Discosporangium mesarthrocarpum]